jgi:hypothetical protein
MGIVLPLAVTDNDFSESIAAVPIFREQETMSSSTHTNGTITLKSFAELASILDVENLPPGPPDSDNADDITAEVTLVNATASEPVVIEPQTTTSVQPLDIASVMAQLAHVSSDLESMARSDARAREQATIELAQYETLAAEREQAERALAEARSVRATAEQLVREAFTSEARIEAARHAAAARSTELLCTHLFAVRVRAAEELASRPHLARVLAERQRKEREQTEAAARVEQERESRRFNTFEAAKQAQREGRLDEARTILVRLATDFPNDEQIQSGLDSVRWQIQHIRTAPAEEALGAIVRRPYRDDPQAAIDRLAAIDTHELPEDLARRVFGVWSKICLTLVRQSGMHDPRRHSPSRSRGLIFARRFTDGPYIAVSALGLSGWHVGDEVGDKRIIDASRPLEDR